MAGQRSGHPRLAGGNAGKVWVPSEEPGMTIPVGMACDAA
jgi:hypothetical protein